jgi:hypothetical protein
MRIIKLQKNSGCILEAVVFSNGKVCACWQTPVPEVAIYESLSQFLSVRTPEKGYTIISEFDGELISEKTTVKVKLSLGPEDKNLSYHKLLIKITEMNNGSLNKKDATTLLSSFLNCERKYVSRNIGTNVYRLVNEGFLKKISPGHYIATN